ncbi:hypothetical protein BC835DRAFT_668947 [Cytidiella melzeri]|nr:hypothetical protein BC835DRAFT_668947 [Cytidiella melzeri]
MVKSRISSDNITREVFSRFTSMYSEILEMQLQIMYTGTTLADAMPKVLKTVTTISQGNMQYSEKALSALLMKLSTFLVVLPKPDLSPSQAESLSQEICAPLPFDTTAASSSPPLPPPIDTATAPSLTPTTTTVADTPTSTTAASDGTPPPQPASADRTSSACSDVAARKRAKLARKREGLSSRGSRSTLDATAPTFVETEAPIAGASHWLNDIFSRVDCDPHASAVMDPRPACP